MDAQVQTLPLTGDPGFEALTAAIRTIDIEKFRSGLIPTAAEVSALDDAVASYNADLEKYETQPSQLQTLLWEKEIIEGKRFRCVAWKAAVRRLPREILIEIFVLTIPKDRPIKITKGEGEETYSGASAIVLSPVCLAWRVCIIGYADFWTNIFLDLGRATAESTQAFELIVERSRGKPLSLELNDTPNTAKGTIQFPGLAESSAREELARAIFNIPERWQKLNLAIRKSIPSNISSLHFPQLHTLQLCVHLALSGVIPQGPATSIFESAPQLRTLRLFSTPLPALNPYSVEHLQLHGFFVTTDIFATLSRCTNLRELELDLDNGLAVGQGEMPWPASRHITLTNLATLRISFPDFENRPHAENAQEQQLANVFDRLTVPNLTSLYMDGDFGEVVVDSLGRLFRRSNCPVTTIVAGPVATFLLGALCHFRPSY